MSTEKISAGRVALIRTAADIAPKIVAAGAGGLSATTLIAVLATFGVDISAPLASLLVTVVALVCGYIKADTPLLANLQREAVKYAEPGATTLAPDEVAAPTDAVGEIVKALA